MSTFASAVCLLLPHPCLEGQYLTVSRRKSETQWGLPGGKVDPGESNLEALLREVQEETGLMLKSDLVEPLYSAMCPGKGENPCDFWVTTYISKEATPAVGVRTDDDILVSWKGFDVLTDTAACPFAEYNEGVTLAYRAYHGELCA
jgi:8-oxo-dGTP pyrophosphatase MutT (NUDIX family)